MDIGGVLHGEWKDEYDEETGELKKRRTFAQVCGELTMDADTRGNETKKGIRRNVSFRVRIAKVEFVRCTIYAGKKGKPDPPAYWIASRLKQNEQVIVIGGFVVWFYRNRKDDELHQAYDMYPIFVISCKAFSDPDAYAQIHGSGCADPMFSTEDEVDEVPTEDDDGVPYLPF